jgi:2-aminoadipate transaminase
MDGRSGSSSMRLNFAGVPDEDIREGIRRIGAIMDGDSGLLGTLTGSPPPRRATQPPPAPAAGGAVPAEGARAEGGELSPLADIVALPRRDAEDAGRPARLRRDR